MRILLITAILMLAACTNVTQSGERASDSLRRNTYNSMEKWQSLLKYDPPPTEPQSPPERYCYQVLQDVVCYDAPQPHLTAKFLGSQGAGTAVLANPGEAAIVEQRPTEAPFYVHEAPYVQPDGQQAISSRTLPPPGADGTYYPPREDHQTGAPRRLMPRR